MTAGCGGSVWNGLSDSQRQAARKLLPPKGKGNKGNWGNWYIYREPTTINPPHRLIIRKKVHGRIVEEHVITDEKPRSVVTPLMVVPSSYTIESE